MVQQISNNEVYLLIKYIKSVLWRVAKRLSYTEEARCLKVKQNLNLNFHLQQIFSKRYFSSDFLQKLIASFFSNRFPFKFQYREKTNKRKFNKFL